MKEFLKSMQYAAACIPLLVLIGMFFAAGQSSVIGLVFLSSLNYSDTLILAFRPLSFLPYIVVASLGAVLAFLLISVVALALASSWAMFIDHLKKPYRQRKALESVGLRAVRFDQVQQQTQILANVDIQQVNLEDYNAALLELQKQYVDLRKWEKNSVDLVNIYADVDDIQKNLALFRPHKGDNVDVGMFVGSWWNNLSPSGKGMVGSIFYFLSDFQLFALYILEETSFL